MPTTLQNLNVLFNDSTTQGTAWFGVRSTRFLANGTFTIPTGVNAVKVTIIGGGGGSAGSGGCASASGGGGGGGTAFRWLVGLTPGNTISVTVGAGGTAGAATGAGGVGGNSSISSGTQSITTVTGIGGGRSLWNNAGITGVGGGTTSADLSFTGQNGVGLAGGQTCFCAPSLLATAGLANTGQGAGGSNAGGVGFAGGSGVVIFEY